MTPAAPAPSPESRVLFSELGRINRVAAGMAIITTVMIAIDVLSGFALGGWTIIVGVVVFILAATLYSVGRYHTIRLTEHQLAVGRERFAPSDFDTTFGVQGREALTDDECALILDVFPIPRDASVHLAGKAWGKTMTAEMIVMLANSSRKKTVIQSFRADELSPILATWLEGHEPPG